MPSRTLTLLGLRLKELRKQRGHTQASLAEAAEISYKYYQEIEGGRRDDLKVSTLIRLSEALGCDLKTLLDFSDVDAAEPKRKRAANS